MLPTTLLAQDEKAKLAELERQVWAVNDEGLIDLETKIVRFIQADPYQAIPFYLLSELRLRDFANHPEDLGLIRQASDFAQQAVDLEPKKDIGYVAMANTLDLMGQSDKGVDLLNIAASSGVEPTWRFYFTIARLGGSNSKQERTMGLFEQAFAIEESEHDIIAPYVIASLRSNTKGDKLLEELHRWNQKFPHHLFKQAVAQSFVENKKYDQAHLIYQSIYKSQPDVLEAALNDAILMYRHLNQGKQALATLYAIKKKQTGSAEFTRSNSELVDIHIALAEAKSGNFKKAEEYFSNAVHNGADALTLLQMIHENYRTPPARKMLYSLLKKLSEDLQPTALLYAMMGETLSEDHKNYEKASQTFEAAITLDPMRSDFFNGLGLARYNLKQYDSALSAFRSAMRLDPADGIARYNVACILALQGEAEEAIEHLADAFAIDSRLKRSAAKDEDLKTLRQRSDFKNLLNQNTPAISQEKKKMRELDQFLGDDSAEEDLEPSDPAH